MQLQPHHLAIYTRDLAALEQFYTHILGCTVVRRWDDVGIIFVDAGGLALELTRLDDPLDSAGLHLLDHGVGMNHLAFKVDHIDILYNQLIERGARTLAPPADYRELRSAFIADPDGNVLELVEETIDACRA